jgi:putative ABC transport system permease protein
MLRKVGSAWRLFRAAPAASLAVSGVLGLAMATTAAVFILVDALLLHPLPVPDQERILHLGGLADPPSRDPVAWWGQAPSLDSIATYDSGQVSVDGGGGLQIARGSVVSADFFRVFEARARAGRTFGREDEKPGLNQVVVLSQRFRRSYLPDRPSALGAQIRVNGIPHVVVGVAPDGFDFPGATELWIPRRLGRSPKGRLLLASDDSVRERRTAGWVGRLRPGASVDQAARDLEVLRVRLHEMYTPRTGLQFGDMVGVKPLREVVSQDLRPALRLLLIGAVLVLLVAAANCSTFLLSRAAARRPEFALREALGATPMRLRLQTLTEALAFALVSGGLALVLILGLLVAVQRWYSAYLDHRPPDSNVLGTAILASALLAIVVGLAAGALAAWQLSGRPTFDALRDHAVGLGSHGGSRMRRALVVLQVAAALVLTNSAVLALQSFRNLTRLDLGFEPDGAVAAEVFFRQGALAKAPLLAAQQSMIDAVAALPQVTAAGAVSALPLSSRGRGQIFIRRRGVYKACTTAQVAGDYFRAMGIPMLAGRTFLRGEADAIVLGSRVARTFWPEGNPIGDVIVLDGERQPRRVVGIVRDTQSPLPGLEPELQIYLPYAGPYRGQLSASSTEIVARCQGRCEAITAVLRARLGGAVAGADVRTATVANLISRASYPAKARALLSSAYAAVVLGVALVGVYALVSYLSFLRRREVILRMTLGARPEQVLILLAGEGLVLASLGVLLGGFASLSAAGVLRSLLFGVDSLSPGTLATTAAVLLIGALVASLIPAIQASRREPSEVLR